MLSPVIMIGCGGSGTKAVRYVRDSVTRRLREVGWTEPLPTAWSFIGVDTNVEQEQPMEIPVLPSEDFLGLSSNINSYASLQNLLLQTRFTPNSQDYRRHFMGWLPHTEVARGINLTQAAGQIRAVGRAAGLYTLETIFKDKLQQAFTDAEAAGGLASVSTRLGVPHSEEVVPLVVVCASISGGTGAGIVLDVLELIRRMDAQGGFPMLVLFTNDIFERERRTPAMAANSLAVLSELLAAYWADDNATYGDGETDGNYVAGDIFESREPNPGQGPAAVFVVGSKSMRQARIGDSSVDVYQAVGEALSGWVTELTIQERVQAWIGGNWRANATGNMGGYPFGKDLQPGVMSSFGAATITVGRSRFERWARDLLCHEMLDTIVNGHLRVIHTLDTDDPLKEAERIDAIAERYWPVIYGDEYPVGDRLPDRDLSGIAATAGRFFTKSDEEISGKIRDDLDEVLTDLRMSGHDWLASLQTAHDYCLDSVRQEARSISSEDRRDWGEQVTRDACRTVSYVIAESSLAVAMKCLTKLISHVKGEMAGMKEETQGRIDTAEESWNDARNTLGNRGSGGLDRDSGEVSGALQASVDLLLQEWHSARQEAVFKLVGFALGGVFANIGKVLKQAGKTATKALVSDEAKLWPTDIASIPERYRPSTIELPLESENEWRQLLEGLCEAACSAAVRRSTSLASASWSLIAGDVFQEDDGPVLTPLVIPESNTWDWSPGEHVPKYRCDMQIDSIRDRVESWMSTGTFTRVIREGIRSYLSPDDEYDRDAGVNYDARCTSFREQFKRAVDIAQPLIDIDDHLEQIVYDDQHRGVRVNVECSPLPLDATHPSVSDATELLGRAVRLRDGDPASILITSSLAMPVHPMIIKSLTDPIADAVSSYRGDQAQLQSGFWLGRRARNLKHFVPVPSEVLESMIRGFAVARLCGYVSVSLDGPIQISGWPDEGDEQQIVRFPWPLLSWAKDDSDVLPRLLESFVLCYAEVGARQLDAFEAYRRLYELGNRGSLRGYLSDVDSILKGGNPPCKTVDIPTALGGSDDGDRRLMAVGYLEAIIEWLRSLEGKPLNGREVAKRNGFAGDEVAMAELLPLARICYEDVLKDILHLGGERQRVRM